MARMVDFPLYPKLIPEEEHMRITLETADREPQKADVDDNGNWVEAAIGAAWAWCRYTGAAQVTARDPDGVRIATVGCEIHDD